MRLACAARRRLLEDVEIMIPACLADRTFRDALTGAEVRPTRAGDTAWVFVGEVFATAPVAILEDPLTRHVQRPTCHGL